MTEEQLTLFGATEGALELKTRSKDEAFNDYNAFLDKFSVKKTTDDCYTPAPVYQAVLDFVGTLTDLTGRTVVRPFYPGGDYEAFEYPEECVVIDNPPFSLLSRICRFYSLHKVPFFLFGPALTLFTAPDCDLTYIIANCDIIYENGAVVRTGFITNLIPDVRIWCCPQLKEAIEKAQARPSKQKRGFFYPDNIVTAATLGKITTHHTELKILKRACRYIKDSDSAKKQGRSLFGGGVYPERESSRRESSRRESSRRESSRRESSRRESSRRESSRIEALPIAA